MGLAPKPQTGKLTPNTMTSRPAFRLSGTIIAPGDKSVSHRALILGALAEGTTCVTGLLESDDVLATAATMQALGADVVQSSNGTWEIKGRGAKGLQSPNAPLDFGNAGTGVRLCMGLVAGQDITATFVGDDSLSRRPMGRVLGPLSQMGAQSTSDENCLPVIMRGTNNPNPAQYTLDIASAQVKSALLLAGLRANGQTIVEEPGPSRDHTENMLRSFGAKIETVSLSSGAKRICLNGPVQLTAQNIKVPGDPSSAAFAIVAALVVPDSDITIKNVMINPTRDGLIRTLSEAGYNISLHNQRDQGGEPVADVSVVYGAKTPLHPPAARAVTMIDEYPILMVLAAFAAGTSRFDGIGELRVKESDRIQKMQALLSCYGVPTQSGKDWIEIEGSGAIFGSIHELQSTEPFSVSGDHRIAMSAMVLAMGGFSPLTIQGAETIGTSYPDFVADMNQLGANILTHKTPIRLVIAVDGPLASGKGTLARKLADHFDLPHMDTGLLYRATARAALEQGTELDNETEIAQLASQLDFPISAVETLRTNEIGAAASKVAALPKVRKALLELQQNFAANPDGAVLDGRDIGTIVCPNADIKLWITASEQVRAERRKQEFAKNGQAITTDMMLAQLRERDARDGKRKNSPMYKAEDALLIDTSKLSIDAALLVALETVERKLAER